MTRTFTLGRYTCVERLGLGPVGELWRAKRFGLIGVEKQYSLTRLHPTVAKDTAAVGRLNAALKLYTELEVELEALSGADNEAARLLHLHEQAVAPGGADTYVVCEFPGFADLRKLRAGFELVAPRERSAELWPAILTFIGRAVATLLSQAQARGLWHGLLSPASIYIGEGGRVLVGELGLAQVLPQKGLAGDANLKVLAPYLPKEVVSGTPTGPDSDIYALGAILDELCGSGSAAGGVKALVERAHATNRTERPSTMAGLAAAFSALPLSPTQSAEAQSTLARLAQQFQLTGDSVPQPVTISERSSAEPLPPPPGARSVDISKANLGGVSGKIRPSVPGAKPSDKADRKAAMRDISDISQPPRNVPAPPPETVTIARHESEETPLPESRPMLATNPKLAAIPPDKPATGPQPKATAPDEKKARTGSQDKPRSPSKDDLRVQKARSGIDWLTSKSDQLPVDDVAGKAPTAPQSAPPKPTPSKPPQSAEKSGEKSSGPSRTPTPPGGQPQKRSNPVSINPRARSVGSRSGSASATTPTAEVDVGEASAADIQAGSPSASTLDERPQSASTLRGAAAAMATGIDSLSAGETNPQLAPVKVFPAKTSKAALGEEPTNPVSLEDVARATEINQKEPGPDKPKRRSGPISEPNPRVLSNTAPAEIVLVPGGGALSSAPDVLGSTGLAKPVDIPDPLTQDFSVDGVPSMEPRKPRTSLLIGGGLALLLAIGLVWLLIAASSQNTQTAKRDGGTSATPDGGAVVQKERVPTDQVILSTTPAATVFLDGTEKGKTPLTLKVTPGTHKLVLVAELYVLTRREVTGGSKLDLKLEGAKLPADVAGEALLKIKCKTDGKMRILVDGNDTGHSCPVEELGVSPGKHVLSFLDPSNDESKEKKIKAKKGKKPAKIKVKY